jgi:hypothetical protein
MLITFNSKAARMTGSPGAPARLLNQRGTLRGIQRLRLPKPERTIQNTLKQKATLEDSCQPGGRNPPKPSGEVGVGRVVADP